MDRPVVSVFLALSLDGFIAGSDGDLSWLNLYATDSALETGYERLLHDIDTLLMGRNTYEKVLSFDSWPYSGKRVVVMTHRPFFARHGEMAQAGPLHEVLERLWEQGARHVYLDGGQVVRQGLADGLVDELTLSWVPVILGDGIGLFHGLQNRSAWEANEVRRLPSGLVQTSYRSPFPKEADHKGGGVS
ncbi:MAG: dihydrofolate reductase [Propionivibrio sp.]|uniref:Dihydrofolate reductase n=1 Tax=Candidatus Propionivibrio dominans TaxID=2954373 RepID=A0A9D7I7V2_9RHOO|nr:dihydrofolate reductase [Candidatus Propionivibrio dominans]MBL0166319.1 dihydrofolate reductase [Propionivibrio sp.]